MSLLPDSLFPPIEPNASGRLKVDEIHDLYWETCGNPQGIPVLFLHGGPGGGLSPVHRRFFHPAHYHIVLFDQRGAGQSTPLGETRANTTQLLIDDIERLREMLGVRQWLLFGGSWGSTLALAYGQAHPERCLGFILRGIFLFGQDEVDWFLHGMRLFFPEVHAVFAAEIPAEERGDLLKAYTQRLFSNDLKISLPAARAWARYEGSSSYLVPNPDAIAGFMADRVALGLSRLEAHYFVNHGFMEPDQLLRNLDRIRDLPAWIVQGRYDMVCPPVSAWRLSLAWPQAQFELLPTAGHSAMEPGIAAALVRATEGFRVRMNKTP